MDDLTVLPPDKDIFHEKRGATTKQKEHLVKARVKAKETMERRKKADAEAQEKEKAKEVAENVKLDVAESSSDEEEEIVKPPPLRKQKGSRKPARSEEETELHRFEKFMKNMNQFEDFKAQAIADAEEAKKIKLSIPKDEYDYIQSLLDKDKLDRANPVVAKKADPTPEIPKAVIRSLRTQRVNSRCGRFGS